MYALIASRQVEETKTAKIIPPLKRPSPGHSLCHFNHESGLLCNTGYRVKMLTLNRLQ